jgi:energy-coupling factor transporter ATP-binding protein EcfA2
VWFQINEEYFKMTELNKMFSVRSDSNDDTYMNLLLGHLFEENQQVVSFAVTVEDSSVEGLIKKLDFLDATTAVLRKGLWCKQTYEENRVLKLDEFNAIQICQRFSFDRDDRMMYPSDITVDYIGNSSELADKLLKILGAIEPKPKTNMGNIQVLIQTQNGLDTVPVGRAAVEFIPTNYTPKNVEDIEFVVKEFNKKQPSGRIVILDGVAGSGKTTLVRAVVNKIPKSNFIIIPPNMVASLNDPSFMGFFVQSSNLHAQPLTLVIEDADSCLVSRDESNISAISTLLNMTDGIIGQMLDIRVIATTNVRADNIDEAVMRPGRLLKQITFDALSPEQANTVHKRLTGQEGTYTSPKTLAEIYTATKIDVPLPGKKKVTKVGFGS